MKYNFQKVEKKWQKKWLEEKVFRAREDSKKPKYYQLETFPYPSAAGLHVGHPKGYIAEDIHARYMRMKGCEVLYTMGWDAFGLPTENYAIKVGRSPKDVAEENIKNFRRQVQMFGFSYDWDREINTSSPEYYKWTQWLFIQLWKKGLAYRAKAKVNWCPSCLTVLANEQVKQKSEALNSKSETFGGVCERCETPVEQREMEQWFFRITDYAERLLADLRGLNWPASTIKRQEDWIGKSEGAEITFYLDFKKNPKDNDRRGPNGERAHLKVFTTRPDTIFGATYLVLSPEHPWVLLATDDAHDVLANKVEVKKYIESAKHKTELRRQEEAKEKTGVELKGVKAINPATKEEIPIWVANYVLMGYGTGAIMAVPAHDERDFEFAKKFGLPIKMVVCPHYPATTCPVLDNAYTGEGHLVDSGKFNGMEAEKAKWEITKLVGGERKVQYKLRDWSVSRQRYWGCPIPMIYCEKCGTQPVPDKDLPVLLPDIENYRPKGMPPLASAKEFIETKCPGCGGRAERSAETLDTFVDSSWYYLRYADPQNSKEIFDNKKAEHWLPVDLYVIGAEHTVLHLLYSRFIAKFLHDEGWLNFDEPFLKLRHQGLILGADSKKMSKSKGNVVNPDEIIAEFGADTSRLYYMFMGPFEESAPWDPKGILGVERFLKRFWKFMTGVIANNANDKSNNANNEKILHRTIKKVGEDIENLKFNTAISALMILLNELEKSESQLSIVNCQLLVKLLHPFAPHMAQELWSEMGHETFLDFEPWPKFDPALIKEETFTLVIQVNGRVRDTVEVDAEISESEATMLALEREKIKTLLGGNDPKKVIYIPGKLINLVA